MCRAVRWRRLKRRRRTRVPTMTISKCSTLRVRSCCNDICLLLAFYLQRVVLEHFLKLGAADNSSGHVMAVATMKRIVPPSVILSWLWLVGTTSDFGAQTFARVRIWRPFRVPSQTGELFCKETSVQCFPAPTKSESLKRNVWILRFWISIIFREGGKG